VLRGAWGCSGYFGRYEVSSKELAEKVKQNIREVSMSRKFNLGNYQMLDIGMVCTISSDMDIGETMVMLNKAIIKTADVVEPSRQAGLK
jgi:hypothetical protein